MADWKIELAQIDLMPHPNAENLELAKVGERQYVVQKGLYKNGDFVISVPEKSLLPPELTSGFENYLKGVDKNRVGIVKLRGEISEGLLLNPDKVLGRDGFTPDFDFTSEGLAEYLGIKEYIPPIPTHLAGIQGNMSLPFTPHDCKQFSINSDRELNIGDEIVVTEKIHGTQINVTIELTNKSVSKIEVTSKGLGKANNVLLLDDTSKTNFYWEAFNNSKLQTVVEELFGKENTTTVVQLVGEAVPIQKGFPYGFTTPDVLLYRIIVDRKTLPLSAIPDKLLEKWVPILYRDKWQGRETAEYVKSLANGNSCLANHIKEGVVVSSIQNPHVFLKFVSNAYAKKQTGEEFN